MDNYCEVFRRAKEQYDYHKGIGDVSFCVRLEKIFPDLISEEERKLNAIIKIVKETNLIDWNYKSADLVAFLESLKQRGNPSALNR